MTMKFNFGLIGLAFILLISCVNNETKKQNTDSDSLKYEIINDEIYETSNKAQLIEYVVYKDTIYTEEAFEKILLDIYQRNKDKDLFDNFNSPTVFAIYVFTSNEILNKDKSAWICMLSKGPRDLEPRLSFNSLKIKSLHGLNDNVKSKDEIAYENLKFYLQERNLELCSFYDKLGDMELECIHKADSKYPDYGVKHTEYASKLMKEERTKLKNQYNLADSIFVRVAIFGMNYCK